MADTNFNVEQGTNFHLDVEILDGDGDPVDLSTALIIGQVRKTASNKKIEASFSVINTDLVAGQFAIELSAPVTSQLKCNPSFAAQRVITPFAYDIEIHYVDGTVNRILSGVLYVSPEVTR